MTSRSELRRLAVMRGEPVPEFPLEPAGADGHPPAPAASPVAPLPAQDGATGQDAREVLPPWTLAPAPPSDPPSLAGPSGLSSPSTHPQREEGSPDSGPAAGARPDDAPAAGTTPGQEGLARWKAAESANAKARRNGRGRYPVKRRGDGYKPGMTRRLPPGAAS